MFRKFMLLAGVVGMISAACADTIIPGGNVSGTWAAAGSPFLIMGEITVPSGQTLIIQPGVQVIFQGHYKLIVNGWLNAIGTEQDSILFTAADTSVGWHGIRFVNAADSSRVLYCHLTYGVASGIGITPDKYGGAIFCDNSSPTIQNCLIDNCEADPGGNGGTGGAIHCRNSSNAVIVGNVIISNMAPFGAGLACDDSSPMVEGNAIIANTATFEAGGGIRLWNSHPLINNNTISGNTTHNRGGGICSYANSSPEIIGNTISGNTANSDGGGIYVGGNPLISNNLITENTSNGSGGGISVGEGFNPSITGNSITENIAANGGGISCYISSPSISGNTITGNSAAICGGGIYCHNSGAMVGENVMEYNSALHSGGGLFFESSSMTIQWNTIRFNTAGVTPGGQGGGIAGYSNSSGVITRNLILGNSAVLQNNPTLEVGGGGMSFDGTGCNPFVTNNTLDSNYTIFGTGGGIFVDWNAMPIIHNNIIANCPDGSGIYVSSVGGQRDIKYNNSWGNADGNYTGNINLHPSNISANPLFAIGQGGSYYLSQTAAGQSQQSPCVNAGDPTTPMIEGTTRTDGVQDQGIIDIGFHYEAVPPPPVMVELIPYDPPIEIPASGGSFSYNIEGSNSTTQLVNCDVWCKILKPNGLYTNPVMGPVVITLPGNVSMNRDRTQNIPAYAPAGSYSFYGYIGDYPDSVWDSDSFPFTKLGTMNWGPGGGDWNNTGESFFIGAHNAPLSGSGATPTIKANPNPFNPTTVLRFDLPQAGWVKLEVFDIRGRLVSGSGTTPTTTLVNGWRQAGTHELTFDAGDLPSGMYFARLEAGEYVGVQKLILLK